MNESTNVCCSTMVQSHTFEHVGLWWDIPDQNHNSRAFKQESRVCRKALCIVYLKPINNYRTFAMLKVPSGRDNIEHSSNHAPIEPAA